MNRRHYDPDDYYQEYALALLEGATEQAANKRARRASRISGRIGGQQPLRLNNVTPTGGEFSDLFVDTLTLDSRHPVEVESAFAKQDEDRARLEVLLAHCGDKQREVLEYRWGLVTGRKETFEATAAALGYKWWTSAKHHEQRGLARIARKEAEKDLDPRVLRKRENDRLWRARRRESERSAA